MLTQIHIRDFAIIDTLELDLNSGMTVMTGETGAGKSILVDALGLVLGDRADSDVVRHGRERAEIHANFDISALIPVQQWLKEHDLDEETECMIRRVVASNGRSKGYINGRPAPAQLMKELGEMLVDIHGQHQHQSLLKAEVQRTQLDEYCGNDTSVAQVRETHRQWRKTADQLDTLRRAAADRNARIDMLRYHVNELDALELGEQEWQRLEEEHKRLANGGQLLERCSTVLNTLYENDETSLLSLLNHCVSDLEQFRDIDSRLAGVCTMLGEAAIQIQEGSNELRHFIDSVDLDPERLQWLEERMGAIHDLARKHRVEPEELTGLHTTLTQELADLENADIQLEALQKALKSLEEDYCKAAAKLSEARRKGATKLGKAVTAIIQQLGMPAGKFQAALLPREEQAPHPHGQESISFEVSANPGQPARPLAKVASGGELSRISLAIQVLLAKGQQIPTLIFDEVDTGVGGAVAETVGRQLRTLGGSHQVLCVTHLPQVAALGHHHLNVAKQSKGNSTATRIQVLDTSQRQEEIARMLGGMEITPQTRAHAEEMISRAEALA